MNASERYLAGLARKTFLSLWSYPNVHYAPAKELTDLLVVCGNDVVLFQDKQSDFPTSGDLEADWSRWFRRTIAAGAKQVWGAERKLRDAGRRLYKDAACRIPLPLDLPTPDDASFHLVVVVHGSAKACRAHLGGSGSLMIEMNLNGLEAHTRPFAIGDLDRSRTFVHVLDDTTLDIVMEARDTITDFTHYLRKKVALLRSGIFTRAAGEEELLANYLTSYRNREHDFDLSAEERIDGLPEGFWDDFRASLQRKTQRAQDRISYVWDRCSSHTDALHAFGGGERRDVGWE